MISIKQISPRDLVPSFLIKLTVASGIIGVLSIAGIMFPEVGNNIPVLEVKNTEASCSTRVSGYYRSNGTYVSGHSRSCADGNPYNNYSYH